MVSLWEDQRRAGVNSHSHARGGALEEIKATMKRGVAAKKLRECTENQICELDAVFGRTVADTNRRDVLGLLQHGAATRRHRAPQIGRAHV